jgi:ankyrin repeat protein
MLLPELASDIVDAADEVENTALHFCQKTNCASKVTETLLSAKASVDIKNKAGESALNDSSEETS